MKDGQYEIEFWKDLSKSLITPEDFGYIALFVAIVKNKSCDNALREVKGRLTNLEFEKNYEKWYSYNEDRK